MNLPFQRHILQRPLTNHDSLIQMTRDQIRQQTRCKDHIGASAGPRKSTSCIDLEVPSPPLVVDDDLSIWVPPKAKDRHGLEGEEVRPQTKQETVRKVDAVLHSMDLIVDGKGFLHPRKSKGNKDERTKHNDRSWDRKNRSFKEEHKGGSNSEETIVMKPPSRRDATHWGNHNDSVSSIPYGLLVQDDTGLRQHPKTPSSRNNRKGMASSSTLDTESMTRTPASNGRSSFQLSSSTFQSTTPRHHTPDRHDFLNHLISPLPDEPTSGIRKKGDITDNEQDLASFLNSPAKESRRHLHEESQTGPVSRNTFFVPIISKSKMTRVSRKMGTVPFHSPQRVIRSDRPDVRRSESETLQSPQGEMLHQDDRLKRFHSMPEPSTNMEEEAGRPESTRTPSRSQPSGIVPLPKEKEPKEYAPKTTEQSPRVTSSRRRSERKEIDYQQDTSGRSRETVSTEGNTRRTSSTTGHETSQSDPSRTRSRSSSRGRRKTPFRLEEHLELFSPTKTGGLHSSQRQVLKRVNADGFPIWSLDDSNKITSVRGLDDDQGRMDGRKGNERGISDDDAVSECSDDGAVVVRTRKILVVKKNKGTTSTGGKNTESSRRIQGGRSS